MMKERSLKWTRSRLPMGNDSARVPGAGNGTVSSNPGQRLWESLMYIVAGFQSCSFDMASDSGAAVDTHPRRGHVRGHVCDARACGRNEWKKTKNSE